MTAVLGGTNNTSTDIHTEGTPQNYGYLYLTFSAFTCTRGKYEHFQRERYMGYIYSLHRIDLALVGGDPSVDQIISPEDRICYQGRHESIVDAASNATRSR